MGTNSNINLACFSYFLQNWIEFWVPWNDFSTCVLSHKTDIFNTQIVVTFKKKKHKHFVQGKQLHLKVLTGTIRDEKHVFSNEVRGAVDSTNTDWLQGICEDISSQLIERKCPHRSAYLIYKSKVMVRWNWPTRNRIRIRCTIDIFMAADSLNDLSNDPSLVFRDVNEIKCPNNYWNIRQMLRLSCTLITKDLWVSLRSRYLILLNDH